MEIPTDVGTVQELPAGVLSIKLAQEAVVHIQATGTRVVHIQAIGTRVVHIQATKLDVHTLDTVAQAIDTPPVGTQVVYIQLMATPLIGTQDVLTNTISHMVDIITGVEDPLPKNTTVLKNPLRMRPNAPQQKLRVLVTKQAFVVTIKPHQRGGPKKWGPGHNVAVPCTTNARRTICRLL